MKWPWSKNPEPEPQPQSENRKQLLEDLPKRFDADKYNPIKENQQKQEKVAAVKNATVAWNQVKLSDFSFANLVKIPCFREAGLIGFSALGVMSTIMFLVHKNPAKASNWGVGAGLLGSLVGWEQCRSQRARSFQNVAIAKKAFKNKHNKAEKKDNTE